MAGMKGFPKWYMRRRSVALRLLKRNKPPRHGPDLDLSAYEVAMPEGARLTDLSELPGEALSTVQNVGVRPDERYRSGTYLQYDGDVVYLALSSRAEPGLVVENLLEAVRKREWLRRFWFRACPITLDKFTAFVGAYETAGAFIWCRAGTRVEEPVQACLYMGKKGTVQVPHNIIILEPGSSLHVITGCAIAPSCVRSAHVACTEIYVGRGAELTWTMIHAWRPDTHVRPRTGAIVEEGGRLMLNYVLLSPVASIQFYPTVILLGRGASVGFRNLILGLGRSIIDAGSAAILNAEGARSEIMSRALVKDEADVRLRGRLWARKPSVRGHLECRALLLGEQAKAYAYPSLQADTREAELTHEAAIGRIAEEELFYLMSRGLTQDEAVALMSKGFLDTDIPGLPPSLRAEIKEIVSATVEHAL